MSGWTIGYKRAQLALGKGDEDLAREALKRRKSYADNANTLKAQLDQQKNVVDNLVSNTRLLESKMQEAKSKKDTLKARAQSAKTATKVSEMLGNVNTSSALSAFEKMEEKAYLVHTALFMWLTVEIKMIYYRRSISKQQSARRSLDEKMQTLSKWLTL
ncbi:hypothetical protein ACSBR2_008829 [Camellia fascicularis]